LGLTAVIEDSPGLRRLGDSALQASIEKALATLPEGTHAAVVDVGVDPRGIQAVGLVRLGGGWSVMGVLDKRFRGEWTGHAQVRWSGR
jgi:hypothetical protein